MTPGEADPDGSGGGGWSPARRVPGAKMGAEFLEDMERRGVRVLTVAEALADDWSATPFTRSAVRMRFYFSPGIVFCGVICQNTKQIKDIFFVPAPNMSFWEMGIPTPETRPKVFDMNDIGFRTTN